MYDEELVFNFLISCLAKIICKFKKYINYKTSMHLMNKRMSLEFLRSMQFNLESQFWKQIQGKMTIQNIIEAVISIDKLNQPG